MSSLRRPVRSCLPARLGWLTLTLFLSAAPAAAQFMPYCPPDPCPPPPFCPPVGPGPAGVEPPLAHPIPAPGAVGLPSTAGEPQDPPAPTVAIRVRVLANVATGKEIEYRMTVENRSTAAAHHVLVRNAVPGNAHFVRASPEPTTRTPELRWDLGSLEAGSRREITLVLQPTAGEEVNNCARVQFEHGQCVRTRLARPALKVRKEGPSEAVLYDSLSYKLTVTNTGGAQATKVILADELPAGLEHASGKRRLTWALDTLDAGQSRTVDYQVIAKAAGRLVNRASVAAAEDVRDQVESTVVVREAKLTLDMAGPSRRYLNTPAAYQLVVANAGTAPLHNVIVTNPVPAQAALVSATQGGQFTDNQLRWTLGTLAPGDSRPLDVVLRVQTPGRVCNQASASADRGLLQKAEACTDFSGIPALALEVEDTADPIPVGGITSYRITVRNPGSDPAGNVRVIATVPEQLEITRAAGAADHRKEGQRILYDPLTVPAGGQAQFQIDVRAVRSGDLRFRVELSATPLTAGPVLQEESTTVYASLPSSRPKPPRVRSQRAAPVRATVPGRAALA